MKRFWEIDSLRGLAIIRMVVFNYSFSLFFLNIYNFEAGLFMPGMAAYVFIFLSGLSLTISYSRSKDRKPSELRKKFLLRGAKVFGLGLLITLVTFITFPENFIIFGILHLIGFSIIFGQFFLKFKWLNLVLGIMVILAGIYLQNFSFDFPWLLWLGLAPRYLSTFDYFPVLPWFGFSLIGMFVGNTLYSNGKRKFRIMDLSNNFIVKFLSFLGRNSLTIYLLHQPILILLLMALGFKVF